MQRFEANTIETDILWDLMQYPMEGLSNVRIKFRFNAAYCFPNR